MTSVFDINPTVLEKLQIQLEHELQASFAYQAIAAWCASHKYKACASFFDRQVKEELEHARKLIEYITDRRCMPIFNVMPRPVQDFKALPEVALRAQAIERENTRSVMSVLKAAVDAVDYPTQLLMHWFILEQKEEESWTDEMVSRLNSIPNVDILEGKDSFVIHRLVNIPNPNSKNGPPQHNC